jgi:vacuolar-type H+-ATPase subunit D/Vma8
MALSDEQIEELIVNTTTPLLKEIEDLKRRVNLLENILANVPDDVYP